MSGAPLPALAQLQGQTPPTQARFLLEKFLHGFDVGGRDPSSTNDTHRFFLRPSTIQ